MRFVDEKDVSRVTLRIHQEELLNKKFLPTSTVSSMLKDMEIKEKIPANQYRVKFYNSLKCGKYNSTFLAGIRCINVYSPRKEDTGTASLELTFVVAKE